MQTLVTACPQDFRAYTLRVHRARNAVGERRQHELALFIVTRYDNSYEQASCQTGQAENGESDDRR